MKRNVMWHLGGILEQKRERQIKTMETGMKRGL